MERILVIEDDRSVQKALKRLFESENYAVQIAADGNTGLESFRSTPPDLVILDLNLPGKPGREVCREIKRDSPLLPVIVLSARLKGLTASGLFLGQSKEFFAFLTDLAEDADDARRESEQGEE